MKKVIINGRFLSQRITGVQRYAREICAELDRIAEPGEIEMAVPPDVTELPAYRNIKVVRVGRLKNRLWEHLSFPFYVARKHAVSLNLCNVSPLPSPGIVAIHDVKIKAHPEYFGRGFILWYRLLFSNAMKRARQILTVSQFSKDEILKYYGIASERIDIIPDAWQHFDRIGYDEGALEKYGVKKGEYFFSMCSLEPNKNFKWIAEAARRNPGQIFAVAGSINEKVFADGLGFECPDNMYLIGYVSDEEAKTLMRDSKAFLFPAFYEGFGIPPLEAVSAGARTIVVSDTAVMHELFGDTVNYVDPNAFEIDLEQDAVPCAEVQDVLNRFSWEKSAQMLYQVLKRCDGSR